MYHSMFHIGVAMCHNFSLVVTGGDMCQNLYSVQYSNSVIELQCYSITMLYKNSVTLLQCHSVTLKMCNCVTEYLCSRITLSQCYTVTVSHFNVVTL